MDRKTQYYDEFRCSADKCPITCCKEWKISVDEDTERRWSIIPDAKRLNKLSEYVVTKDEQRVIGLDNKKNCPFLNKRGLCELVIEHGDEILSHTCTVFPRQINDYERYKEYSLVAGCPEVVNILSRVEHIELSDNGQGNELSHIRDLILELIQDAAYSLDKAMMMAFYLLLEIRDNGLESAKCFKDGNFLKRLSETIDNMEFNQEYTFNECNELYLDITYNYVEQGIYKEFLEHTVSLAKDYANEEWQVEQGAAADYFKLLRNYAASEIIATLYLQDYNLDNMIIAMQWIAMEYIAVRQSILLIAHDETLTYEKVRECIVYVTRMTGYDEDDIYEYMQNSFENVIWDWGYFALIIGNIQYTR